jgi:low temperature requirement protein LtrA
LWTGEDGVGRRVSWLELFSDLVFVVVISELTGYLAAHVSLEGVLGFGLLFVAMWWAWIGGTYYNERFETQDVSYRIFTFLQMLLVGVMAVFAHGGLAPAASARFALAYAAVRSLIVFMWLRGGWYAPLFRPVTNRYAVGFILSVLLFIVSAFVSPPLRFGLWGVGLLADLVTPIMTLNLQAGLPRARESKLPERFGLFVLIVLGEAIVGVIHGVAGQAQLNLSTGATAALGMALIFGLWWVYFDFVGRREPRPGVWWGLPWNYLHLPLVMAIAAIGAAVTNILHPPDHTSLTPILWLLAGAVAVALITIGLIELTLARDPDEPTDQRISVPLKLGGGVLALALGAWAGAFGSTALLLSLIPPVLAQMIYGAYVWYRPRMMAT